MPGGRDVDLEDGHRRDLIMGEIDHGGTRLGMRFADRCAQVHAQGGVKVGQGLVELEHRRFAHNGAVDGDGFARGQMGENGLGQEQDGDAAILGRQVVHHRGANGPGARRYIRGPRDHPQECGFGAAGGAGKGDDSPFLVVRSTPLRTWALVVRHRRALGHVQVAQVRVDQAAVGLQEKAVGPFDRPAGGQPPSPRDIYEPMKGGENFN